MSFLSVLGDIAKIGQAVAPEVTAINSAAGAITQQVVNGVILAEQIGGKGADKKQQVINGVLPVVQPLLNTILQSTGTKVTTNSQGVNTAVDQLVEGVVGLFNSMQAGARATTASGAATGQRGSN